MSEALTVSDIKSSKKQAKKSSASESKPRSQLCYILWFFSHYDDAEKRLTLAKNPQFYGGDHPKTYGRDSEIQPTENYKDTIYVLTNNERRVFLELGKNLQIFDNVWKRNNALIFKGLCPSFLFCPN